MDIRRFVSRVSTEAERAEQARLESARLAERAAVLAQPWPRPPQKRKLGRRSRNLLYLDALYAHIRSQDSMDGVEPFAPSWWSPGQAVRRTAKDIETAIAESAAAVPLRSANLATSASAETATAEIAIEEAAVAGSEGAAGSSGAQAEATEEAPPPKEKKVHQSNELKAWFVQYAELQSRKAGWSMSQSLCSAARMAPGLFDQINPDTPRKWRSEPLDDQRGKHSKFDTATVVMLGTVFENLGSKVAQSVLQILKMLAPAFCHRSGRYVIRSPPNCWDPRVQGWVLDAIPNHCHRRSSGLRRTRHYAKQGLTSL